MQYRHFGKIDFQVSALGFGCMRLPIVGDDKAKIDEKKAIEMIRYAIDNGVNYFDTAYVYHEGQSEAVLGKALKDGYRDKVKIASKLPLWAINSESDFDRIFNEQLEKLQTDKIDFYLLHNFNQAQWPRIKDLGVFAWAETKIKEGKIGHLGFSFHDDLSLFKEIVDAYQWGFCQIQYNYMDTDYQAGTEGLKYAASKGIAVVIMEPLKGGKLAQAPKVVQEIWDKAQTKRTPVDWALQWLWNQKEVATVLSGMSTLEQVKQNIESASNSTVNSLDSNDQKLVEKVRLAYEKLAPIPCTGCQYCLPCPQGVNIPKIFQIYNDAVVYDQFVSAKKAYAKIKDEEKNCILCNLCKRKCPQNLEIPELLKLTKSKLTL